jgi:hypothetical protein
MSLRKEHKAQTGHKEATDDLYYMRQAFFFQMATVLGIKRKI